jgi:hypothetical protein
LNKHKAAQIICAAFIYAKRLYIIGVFDRKTGVFTLEIVSTYKKREKPQKVLALMDRCCYNVDIVRVKLGVDTTFFSLFRIYGTRGIAGSRCLLLHFYLFLDKRKTWVFTI